MLVARFRDRIEWFLARWAEWGRREVLREPCSSGLGSLHRQCRNYKKSSQSERTLCSWLPVSGRCRASHGLVAWIQLYLCENWKRGRRAYLHCLEPAVCAGVLGSSVITRQATIQLLPTLLPGYGYLFQPNLATNLWKP